MPQPLRSRWAPAFGPGAARPRRVWRVFGSGPGSAGALRPPDSGLGVQRHAARKQGRSRSAPGVRPWLRGAQCAPRSARGTPGGRRAVGTPG